MSSREIERMERNLERVEQQADEIRLQRDRLVVRVKELEKQLEQAQAEIEKLGAMNLNALESIAGNLKASMEYKVLLEQAQDALFQEVEQGVAYQAALEAAGWVVAAVTSSPRGSIGSINNTYIAQIDRARADRANELINGALAMKYAALKNRAV